MAPETRSRGAPPESRVYHSSPSLKQVQFPSRKKVVRTYGKRKKHEEKASLKQQTLTQIDFVSSFGEDPIVFSDAESDSVPDDKEDQRSRIHGAEDKSKSHEDGVDVGELSPKLEVPKRRTRPKVEVRKRRRTLTKNEGDGCETPAKKHNITSKRRTMGDSPVSSRYHTQTLTQFLGQSSFIANSDSDENEDGGFLDWLREPHSPSIRSITRGDSAEKSNISPKPNAEVDETTNSCSYREESVIPQTPIKSQLGRVGIPSSGHDSIPTTSQVAHHDSLNKLNSPINRVVSPKAIPVPAELTGEFKQCARNPTTLVIEDSFRTESWDSRTQTPTKQNVLRRGRNKESQEETLALGADEISDSLVTSSLEQSTHHVGYSERTSQLEEDLENKSQTPYLGQASPKTRAIIGLREIPDSDEDEDDLPSEDLEQGEDGFIAGAETQLVLEELASFESEQLDGAGPTSTSSLPGSCSNRRGASKTVPNTKPVLNMHQTRSHILNENESPHASLLSSCQKMNLETRRTNKPIRRPLHRPTSEHAPVHSQPLESQRVPLQILQSFPPASARTDIILPLPSETLDSVLGGYEIHLCLPHKIPKQVVRFWLYDGSLLHYMACVEPGIPRGAMWAYRVDQVYELNNPVEGNDMQEEGWINGQIQRYAYLPPAVVGQLLWNLRHAIFENDSKPSNMSDGGEEELHGDSKVSMNDQIQDRTLTNDLTVSRQLATQTRSDLAHPVTSDFKLASSSTKIQQPHTNAERLPTPDHHPCDHPESQCRNPQPRASQATTDSQASTPERRPRSSLQAHHDQSYPSDSVLTFQDHGSSAILLPNSISQLGPSQLLTKSQMLPDSLTCDGPRLPLEIWDSDDEVEDML